jgi:hypothetical protein
MHRYVTRTFNHHLAVVFPGDLGQLTQRLQFCKLRFIVRIGY